MAKRLVQMVFMLWVALTVLFFFFRLLPGDFTDLMVYTGASQESIQLFKEKWGLNDPLYIQYARYLFNLLQLDNLLPELPQLKHSQFRAN